MAVRDTGKEQLIKDTAKRIFFAEGKLHATTQDIADAAGVNRTLVHYYFRSRDILFQQVVEHAGHEIKSLLDAVLQQTIPFPEKLKNLIHVFMEETIAYPYRELFIITETNGYNEVLNKQDHNQYIKPFLAEIKLEIEKGNIKEMDPKQFMMSLFALMAYPVLAGSLNKNILNIKDAEFSKMMKQRKQLIYDMLYTGP